MNITSEKLTIAMRTNISTVMGIVALLLSWATPSRAQLNPFGAQFFYNQYLGNPAMAGITSGWGVGLNARRQWSSIPGGPASQAITVEYGFDRVGLGLNVYNDKAGLMKRTRGVLTYAYHLPLNESQRLHFGLSLGLADERITGGLVGDGGDIAVGRFNERPAFIDGDLGVAYTSSRLNVQVALPDIRAYLRDNEQDLVENPLFFTAVSYKVPLSAGGLLSSVEPKAAFREFRKNERLWDAGAKLAFSNDAASIYAMYHNTKRMSFGLGGFIASTIHVYGIFSTETTAIAQQHVGNNFELSLKLVL